jgi:hypothetical protein
MRCRKKGHREPKQRPYGATRGRYWCWGCDRELVPSNFKSIKKRERQKAKKEIKKHD